MNVKRFAKAVVGPTLGLLGALAQYVVTGHLDQHSLFYFGSGILAGVITYFVPNEQSAVAALQAAFSPVSAGRPDPLAEPPAAAPAAAVAPPSPPVAS